MAKVQLYRPDLQDAPLPAAVIAPRLVPPDGFRITLINNGKPRTLQLLTYLAEAFGRQQAVRSVEVHSKPSAGSPIDEATANTIAARSDLVITGLGDCGACSSCSLVDALYMEKLGVPAAVVITDPFTDVCERVSRRMGFSGYPPIVVPHPAASRSDDWLRRRADECADRLAVLVMPDTADGTIT